MIRALAAIIHDEKTLLVKVFGLPFVSKDIFVVLVLVNLFCCWGQLVPKLAAFFHCLWMGATLLFLELVDILLGRSSIIDRVLSALFFYLFTPIR